MAFEKHVGELEHASRNLAPILVQTCDQILLDHPDKAIVVMGTGCRAAYSVMRKLARRLPGRGSHRRVILLDISTKLLYGKEYPNFVHSQHMGSYYFGRFFMGAEDEKRNEEIFRYAKAAGVLDHKNMVLLDTGFYGNVIRNLRRIILKRSPGPWYKRRKIGMVLFSSNGGTKKEIIKTPSQIGENSGGAIAHWLEFGKIDNLASPAGVKTGSAMVPWRGGMRPVYEPTSEASKKFTALKHRIIAEHVDKYVSERKAA
ncbi:MAG: hypothetical protein Q8R15_02530 [Candidatus Micrarchaeota archaeon]|nr:hypothetical protein [Candidatus Micrarchaeota archaeon]